MLEQINLNRYTQETRLLRVTTPLGSDVLLAECVRGTEAISAGFSFTINALSTIATVVLRSLLGQPVLLELLTSDADRPRPFHGYVTSAEHNGLSRTWGDFVFRQQGRLQYIKCVASRPRIKYRSKDQARLIDLER